MARKNPLNVGGNLDHVTLGLAFHVMPSQTVLQLGEGRIIPGMYPACV